MEKTDSGFTLIEVMITVAIVAILAAVAIPSYQNSVMKGQRTDGKSALLQAAQLLERCYTEFGRYNDVNCPENYAVANNVKSGEEHYQIVATALTTSTFRLEARPISGVVTKDTKCDSFTLTHTNVKGISGTGTADDCW